MTSKQPTDLEWTPVKEQIAKLIEESDDPAGLPNVSRIEALITSQVNQRVKAALPDKREDKSENSGQRMWKDGYNQAISDIEANLKAGGDKQNGL